MENNPVAGKKAVHRKRNAMRIFQKVVKTVIPVTLAIILYAFIRPHFPAATPSTGGSYNWADGFCSVLSLAIGIILLSVISPTNKKNTSHSFDGEEMFDTLAFGFAVIASVAAVILLQLKPTFIESLGFTEWAQQFQQTFTPEIIKWVKVGLFALSFIAGMLSLRRGAQLGIIIFTTAAFISGSLFELLAFSIVGIVPALAGALLRFIGGHGLKLSFKLLKKALNGTIAGFKFIYHSDWADLVKEEAEEEATA